MEKTFIIVCVILGTLLIIICLIRFFKLHSAVIKTDFAPDAVKMAMLYYYLPETVLKIKTTVKVEVHYDSENNKIVAPSKIIERHFEITKEIIADTKEPLMLNYCPNMFMSDNIKYGVNEKGLLENVSITTEDRSSDIISKLTAVPQKMLSKVVESGETGTQGGSVDLKRDLLAEPGTFTKIKEFTAEFVVKAWSLAEKIEWQIQIENEFDNSNYEVFNAGFNINSSDIRETAPSLQDLVNKVCPGSNTTSVKGILTHPLKTIELKFATDTKLGFFTVVDKSKLIIVPVKRAAFVKQVNNIGIQNGLLLSNEIVRPSSMEGLISIPINILKAIVSIPGQIVQLKINNTNKQKELEEAKLNYEKMLLATQALAKTKEQFIEKFKQEIQESILSNHKEIEKLISELKNSLPASK